LAGKRSEQDPLENDVQLDEFEIVTPQKGEQGRSKCDEKAPFVIAFKLRVDK
jgi:hypothetical protein